MTVFLCVAILSVVVYILIANIKTCPGSSVKYSARTECSGFDSHLG